MRFWWFAAGGLVLSVSFVLVAYREYTLYGSVAVFVLLLALALPIVGITGRLFTTALVIAALLCAIDIGDRTKFGELRQHLHHHDLGILMQFIREMNLGFFQQYASVAGSVLVGALAFLIIVVVVWRLESRHSGRLRIPVAGIFALVCGAAVATWSFMGGDYMAAVKRQLPPRMAAERAPWRLSAALASFSESISLSKVLAADRAAFPASKDRLPRAICQNCPDIIIIHLESVYDPIFEQTYSNMPPLSDLIGEGINKWSTLINVHTWGGNSVVTEFELLCSLNHELFGWAGFQPHINVAPFLDGCLGKELKSIGYQNNVLYSLNGSFSNVRKAFSKYGFDHFRDFSSLGLPKKWSELHDRKIYEHLLKALNEPRKAPRSYFVSTNWNHGPHGLNKVTEKFVGPYDAARADTPALADYVNRLNDSISALREVIEYVKSAPYSVVVLAYGDHHPAFAKHYSKETKQTFAEPDYLTPLLIMRNFVGEPLEQKSIISVEEAAYYMAQFAGISPLPSLEDIHTIQVGCSGDQRDCNEKEKGALRAVQLAN